MIWGVFPWFFGWHPFWGSLVTSPAMPWFACCEQASWFFRSNTERPPWQGLQTTSFKWLAINWMIQNLYIGNGWKSPNIHLKLGVWGSRHGFYEYSWKHSFEILFEWISFIPYGIKITSINFINEATWSDKGKKGVNKTNQARNQYTHTLMETNIRTFHVSGSLSCFFRRRHNSGFLISKRSSQNKSQEWTQKELPSRSLTVRTWK